MYLSFSEHRVLRGNWIRTGTDPDGNCFFHAYLYSVEPHTFRERTLEERRQRVHTVKAYVASHVTNDHVLDLVDITAFEPLHESISRYARHKEWTPVDIKDRGIISFRDYFALIPPEWYNDPEFQTYIQQWNHYYAESTRSYLARDGAWMVDHLFPLLMKLLHVDIQFISAETNRPITHGGEMKCFEKTCNTYGIIMYHLGGHFESIGLIEEGSVTRVFTLPFPMYMTELK